MKIQKIMMYEITQDCRIANQDYNQGQIVSKEEVWGWFPSVMKEAPEAGDTITEKPAKTSAKKGKKTDEVTETPEAEEAPEADDTTSEKENA